jgi:hypothetical protein
MGIIDKGLEFYCLEDKDFIVLCLLSFCTLVYDLLIINVLQIKDLNSNS